MNGAERIIDGIFFITMTVTDWVDIFNRPKYKHIIVESLTHCQQQKGLDIYAWVLMSNHLHAIVGTDNETHTIGSIFRDFKKFTSKQITKELESDLQESRRKWMLNRFRLAAANGSQKNKYRLWQDGYHPEPLYTYSFYRQKLDYIHQNPVKQEIVIRPEEYLYRSAIDYAGGEGLIKIKNM